MSEGAAEGAGSIVGKSGLFLIKKKGGGSQWKSDDKDTGGGSEENSLGIGLLTLLA